MSSVIRLFTNPLAANSLIKYDVEPGTVLIDWLLEEYPEGFEGLVRVFVAQDEIDLDDLDHVIEDMQQITILVMPAWQAVGAYVINALIAIAVGLVLNLLFPPKKPGNDGGDESPVYSLNAATNKARLGAPVPCHYGVVNFPPDYCSAPYQFYSHNNESNEMFVDMLFCMGHGKYEIEAGDVFVGDTPISELEKGTAFYYAVSAAGHYRTMGAFSEIINRKLANTAYPYPFRENVYTSPEVSNFSFDDAYTDPEPDPDTGSPGTTGGTLGGDDAEAISFKVEDNFYGGDTYSSQFRNVLVQELHQGDVITVSGTQSNNKTFTVSSVIINKDDPTLMTIFFPDTAYEPYQVVDEKPLSGSYTIDAEQIGMRAGPFRAQKIGQKINEVECDIIFPQGLYRASESGNLKVRTVVFNLTVQEIDEITGDTIGAPIVSEHEVTSRIRNPVRSTVSSGTIPEGSYTAEIQRVTGIPTDLDFGDQMVWDGLKGIVVPTQGWVYGYTSLLMVRLRATHGVGAAARQRVTVKAKRLLEGDTVDSSNPVEVVRDIWKSKRYGLNRPESEMDIAHLDALAAHWATNDVHFNGSFDTKGTGWDAMEAACAMAGARVVQDGGLLTVVADQVQPIRTAMFSSANIVAGSFKTTYNFDTQGDYSGIRVEYRDPINFKPAFVLLPDSEDNDTPDTYNCFGCTEELYAGQYAQYMANVKAKRRKIVDFQTEAEGLIPRFGDRILVSHPMTDIAQSGVFVEQIDATTWRVDQALDWAGGDSVIIVRDELGVPSEPYAVTMGGTANIVVFTVEPTQTITDSQGVEPTNFLHGKTYDVSKDYIVSKVVPAGDNIVGIQGQVYDEAVYDGAPPQMGGT